MRERDRRSADQRISMTDWNIFCQDTENTMGPLYPILLASFSLYFVFSRISGQVIVFYFGGHVDDSCKKY